MRKTLLILICFFVFCWWIPAKETQDVQIKNESGKTKNIVVPSAEEVFKLINLHQIDKVHVVTTVNKDGSPHASIVGIRAINNLLKFRASSKIALARNLQRTKKAVITVYKIPKQELPLSKHEGVRVTVELVEDAKRIKTLDKGKDLKSIYSMKIVKIENLHSEIKNGKDV